MGNLVFRVLINGTEVMKEEMKRRRRSYENVKVFATNPWIRALPGYMKDLSISVINVPLTKLVPQAASFKGSTNIELHGADRCIDGETKRDKGNNCHGKPDPTPWLAIDFGGEDKMVSIAKVHIFDIYLESTLEIVEFRLTNEKPTPGEGMFSGGHLVGTCCKTPVVAPQWWGGQITDWEPGWEDRVGRYLIIQMNHGNESRGITLNEVQATGISHPKVKAKEVDKEVSRSSDCTTTALPCNREAYLARTGRILLPKLNSSLGKNQHFCH